jgi:hypothetical protein
MSEATISLLSLVLTLVVGIASAVLVPALKKVADAKLGVAHADLLFSWAETLVKSAEETLGAGTGTSKYALVLSGLQAFTDRNKLKVDEASLHAAIQAAVLELKNSTPATFSAGELLNVAAPAQIVNISNQPQPQG